MIHSTNCGDPEWTTIIIYAHSTYLTPQQKNETESALQQTHDILADGFTDTATRKIQLVELTTGEPNGTTTTTTERYRISRKELGYILGKNYRGLKKLFNIELNDALNVCIGNTVEWTQWIIIINFISEQQSKYSIQEYKEEHGNAVAQYTIKKEFPEPKQSKSWWFRSLTQTQQSRTFCQRHNIISIRL